MNNQIGVVVFGPNGLGHASLFWSFLYELRKKEHPFLCQIPRSFGWLLPSCMNPERGGVVSYDGKPNEREGVLVLSGTFLDRPEVDFDYQFSSVFIFFNPTLTDVFRLKRFLKKVQSHGYQQEDIHLILVGEGIPGGLMSDLIQEATQPLSFVFPYAPKPFLMAENKRMVLQEIGAKSVILKNLQQMAEKAFQKNRERPFHFKSEEPNLKDSWPQMQSRIVNQLWEKLTEDRLTFQRIDEAIDQSLKKEMWAGPKEVVTPALFSAIRKGFGA